MSFIGTPSHTPDRVCVAFKHAQTLPRTRVPEANRSVYGAGQNMVLISTPNRSPDEVRVALQLT